MRLRLQHTGWSGLRLEVGGIVLDVDPASPAGLPAVLTWSETERLGGAAKAPSLAADPRLLAHLGRHGAALRDGVQTALGAITLLPSAFQPIPYAVPAEAVRKTASALRHPGQAARRLSRTLRRPSDPPYAVEIGVEGLRVVLLQQALHRYTSPRALASLVERHGGADLLVAGTDYEDEVATGRQLNTFGARHLVLADLVGPVRRLLGLPVRPLSVALAAAPAHTVPLQEGQELSWEL